MSFESFIARRYLRPKRKINIISVISFISVLGITIGTAALICVLSVFNGFSSVVRDLLVKFDPHIRITSDSGKTIGKPNELLTGLRNNPQVSGAGLFVSGRSAIIRKDGLRVIQVRGMSRHDLSTAVGVDKKIINGSFMDSSSDIPHSIVIGSMLSYSLNAMVGDTISLLSQSGIEEALTANGQPVIIPCIITGVFDSGNKEYDTYVAYTNLSTARDLFAISSGAMGIEARLHNFTEAEEFGAQLRKELGSTYQVETWQDLHKDLFGVMQLERWMAFIILSLIIVVAAFNVFGSLTMTVIKKKRDIGILKAMGSKDSNILRVFMMDGLFVGLLGTVTGTLLGLTVCMLQQQFGFYKLDNSFYIIPAIPVEIRMLDIVVVTCSSLLLSSVAAIYPARRAARLQPAEAVRTID